MKELGRVVASLLGIVLVFAVLELLARIPFSTGALVRTPPPTVENPFQPYLGWENPPNYTDRGVLARGLHPWTVRTDGAGESVTPDFNDPDPEVSVAVVGGSVVFGIGETDNAHTIPAALERELRRRTGAKVEVHNLAVRGYTSIQEALALERFLATHRADVTVSISGFNDAVVAAVSGPEEFGLLPRRDPKVELMRSIERGDLAVVRVAGVLALQALRRRSCLVDLLGKVADRVPRPPIQSKWRSVPVADSADLVRRAELVRGHYAMMDALSRQCGARFFMFLQPTALLKRRLTASERQAMDSLDTGLMARVAPAVRVLYPALAAGEKPYEFHDLTRCFDDFAPSAFGDDCHILDGATATVAAAVCDVIEPAVREAAARRAAPQTVSARRR
jgi:hypothetical protein